ncbi:hypothetical protein ACWEF9_29590 [Streptomyces sp. NPDC004980]
MAGRREPELEWRTDPGWDELLRITRLKDLPTSEAERLLKARGVPEGDRQSILDFAGGHPLALRLAAEVSLRGEPVHASTSSGKDVIRVLLGQLVGSVPSSAHRQALEVSAHALTTTEELLRAAIPSAPADELFTWLSGLPFIELGKHGVHPHDVVRAVLDSDLRWRDPEGYAGMHHGMREHLIGRAVTAEGADVLPAMSAVTYLHRHNGFLARYVSWPSDGREYEDVLRAEESDVFTELVRKAHGRRSAEVAAHWAAEHRYSVRVCRSAVDGSILAGWVCAVFEEPDQDTVSADPVVAAAWQHARSTTPVRQGERVALVRFLLQPQAPDGPSAVMDLFLHRTVYEFVLANRLSWSYMAMAENAFWNPMMDYIDLHLLPEPVKSEGHRMSLYAHDWRLIPPRIWLDFSGTLELGGLEAGRTAHRTGGCVVLGREEFETAVRDALRSWHRPDQLDTNVLMRSRMVFEHPDHDASASLRALITAALDALGGAARDQLLKEVLVTTFLRGALTQEAAAEQLHVSFSTYRRHLAAGLERVGEWLWGVEIHGLP